MDRLFSIPALKLSGAFVLTVLMSLFAIALALIFRTADRYLCMAAMIISSCGDVLLMNFRGISRALPNSFTLGAVLFMSAHILYLTAFLYIIKMRGYPVINAGFFFGIGLIASAFILLICFTIKTGNFKFNMFLLCFIYLIFIGANCCMIFSLAYSAKGFALLTAVGALSFFISDAMIGLDRLADISSPLSDKLVWWFYPVGQVLILLGG